MKVLVLDESGVINSDHNFERYFVLAGILYDLDDFEEIKSCLIPRMDLYRDFLNTEELKSNDLAGTKKINSLIYGSILSDIQNCNLIQPVIYILDKKDSWKIKLYDKKSFCYNKLLEFMIQDLITDGLISEDDEIRILLDHMDFDEYNMKNFKQWLTKNVKQVVSVDMGESQKYNFIQIADLLAGIPKLKGVSPKKIMNDHKLRLVDRCYIHVFPQSKAKEILSK